ncbi:Ribosome biogenesis protein erb1 [Ophiocordyceps camponoti-floridani]|uniref:Ribosome biogenesis protein ERB1 n=1 Tax=Ophiocordyceps camponoti-floridani TaxID=2030778 RepID=A0A8H4QBF6_9HYPO|nr:Ribosome biogenesis protein erb1 [Ophiocordyceps camponoti-floridani]
MGHQKTVKRRLSLPEESSEDDKFMRFLPNAAFTTSDVGLEDDDLCGSGGGEDTENNCEPGRSSQSHHDQNQAEDANGADAVIGPAYRIKIDALGGQRYEYNEIDPIYESDDTDAQEPTNTIGTIPSSLYDSYPHIGYDINGKKIMRPATGEALDALLNSIELPKGWTGLVDPQTGKPLTLTQQELELLQRIQLNELPDGDYDPYPEMVPYFTGIEEKMPLSAAPEPKRRFVPSKHEAKRIAQLHAEAEQETHYDVWAKQDPEQRHAMAIPAPKLAAPSYDLSYNPPPEYLPSAEERRLWENMDAEDREKDYLPVKFESLRKVPGYSEFVKERFERCLDLYLAPRIRKIRLNVDPTSLLPKLPSPAELKPFPTICEAVFRGHEGRVRAVAFSPDGEWLASGGDDGTVRVWALNGYQDWAAKLSADEPVNAVRWRPNRHSFVLAAAAGEDIFFMVPPLCGDAMNRLSRDILSSGFSFVSGESSAHAVPLKTPAARWSRPSTKLEAMGVLVKATLRVQIKSLSWHRRGDFLCSTSPSGQRSSVAIHTLSKHLSQVPFRRLSGLAQTAHFHPSRPLFFVATQRKIRCYDLQRQELVKVMQPGARWISSFDIHPGGDNVIVGSYDRRLLWHDLDLSSRPYKTMRFHTAAIRAVRFHKTLPLFADASDDGTLQIFHGKVVNDLMESATIVPVKVLQAHSVVNKLGVMDIDWHPHQPWLAIWLPSAGFNFHRHSKARWSGLL